MSSKRLVHRKGVVSGGGAPNSASNSLDWDSPSAKTGTVKRRPVSSDCSPTTTDNNELFRPDKTTSGLYVRPKIPIVSDNNHRTKTERYKLKKSTITYANLSLHDSINSDGRRSHGKFATASHRNAKVSDSDSGIASPLSPSSAYSLLVYSDDNYDRCESETEWKLEFEWLENCSCVKQQIQVNLCLCACICACVSICVHAVIVVG